ncbi:DUF3019 domain-containing protein [Thalassotalea sp. 1_MG-2023]|uniref:DUF3019 domain-containing protein n=1 Tax=Thalassotalea sp. 1_MG-2023 TaxID=3062680 RepID=UPI0026E121F5|nr:DUF3019 domain-containing protein [Thalassotalea sp. 1_MG-2023]MDO6427156.1 DUF3019 domain-containing protein [Thalassotalea sp. 1_MG-2023]
MFFNYRKGIAGFVLIILLTVSTYSLAQEALDESITLTATPNNCVTLRQGRTCYAQVIIAWQSNVKGDYCLRHKTTGKSMKCWQKSQKGQWTFEFQGSETTDYQLVSLNKIKVIAKTSINVSWVHKTTPRKRRWRLF